MPLPASHQRTNPISPYMVVSRVIGVPLSHHPFLDGIFPHKPSSYWMLLGYPHDELETPTSTIVSRRFQSTKALSEASWPPPLSLPVSPWPPLPWPVAWFGPSRRTTFWWQKCVGKMVNAWRNGETNCEDARNPNKLWTMVTKWWNLVNYSGKMAKYSMGGFTYQNKIRPGHGQV